MAHSDQRATEPGRHDSNAVKTPTAARQGQKLGRMRYVLTISVVLAIVAMFIVWLGVL